MIVGTGGEKCLLQVNRLTFDLEPTEHQLPVDSMYCACPCMYFKFKL